MATPNKLGTGMTKLMCAAVVADISHGVRRHVHSMDPRHLGRIVDMGLATIEGKELKVTEKGKVFAAINSVMSIGVRSEVTIKS